MNEIGEFFDASSPRGGCRARRRRAAVVALVLLAACRTGRDYPGTSEPRYTGAPLGAAREDRARRDTLRIVSFNIAFARNIDGAIALLTTEAALRDADVLLLQEMDAAGARRIAHVLGMWYVYYPAIFHHRTRRDFGNAILSRWPIVGDAKLVLPHASRYAGTHRTATVATVQIGSSRARVYSTHLGTALDIGSSRRTEQLRAILADAVPHPIVVIGGDLNSASVGRVAERAGYSWPTREGPRTTRFGRWDHIFLKGLKPPGTGASGTVVDARGVSDHVPVWAVGVLQPPRVNARSQRDR